MMVDTSARFITEDISDVAWQAIATPKGSEIVDEI